MSSTQRYFSVLLSGPLCLCLESLAPFRIFSLEMFWSVSKTHTYAEYVHSLASNSVHGCFTVICYPNSSSPCFLLKSHGITDTMLIAGSSHWFCFARMYKCLYYLSLTFLCYRPGWKCLLPEYHIHFVALTFRILDLSQKSHTWPFCSDMELQSPHLPAALGKLSSSHSAGAQAATLSTTMRDLPIYTRFSTTDDSH